MAYWYNVESKLEQTSLTALAQVVSVFDDHDVEGGRYGSRQASSDLLPV